MASKTTYPQTIQPSDVDFTLRASIVSILGYVLDVAGYDADSKGFGVKNLNPENRSWVLSRMAVDIYRQPAEYEQVDIITWVNEYGRLMSTRNFSLCDAQKNCIAAVVTQWAIIDLGSRTPVDLRYIAEAHDTLCNEPSPIDRPRKVPAIEPQTTNMHTVAYSDIDFNHHMNTLRYLSLMIDMLPIDLLSSTKKIHIELNFLHESRYGDKLTVGYELRENKHLFEIKNNENLAVCRASIEWID